MSAPTDASYRLYVELTLTSENPDVLSAAGYDWLTLGPVAALSQEPWTGSPGTEDGLRSARQDAGDPWAGIALPEGSAVVVDRRGASLDRRPADSSVLPWLSAELRRQPAQTLLHMGSDTLTVDFDPDLGALVKLTWEVEEAAFSKPGVADAILRTLWSVAGAYQPVFGHLSYGNMGGRTELERNLPRMQGNSYLNAPRWREFLRGYSWWTVVPNELLPQLGGISALRESGGFHEVFELPGGAVWLLATRRFADYDRAAIEAVWSALRPALIPGTPRPAAVYPGDPPNRMTRFSTR